MSVTDPEVDQPRGAANARWDGPARRDGERSRALAELSHALAEAIDDTGSVLDCVVKLISGFLGDTAVIRLLEDAGTTMRIAAVADPDEAVTGRVMEVLRASPSVLHLMPPYAEAIERMTPVVMSGGPVIDEDRNVTDDTRRAIAELDVRATIICPLRVRGQVIGTLGLWRRGDRALHSERDKQFAQDLADRAALAIDNARLVESLRSEVEQRTRAQADMELSAQLLRRGEEKRRLLVQSLVAAEEEQRRRIAVDVHDDSIQAMAALALRLQVLRRHAPSVEFAERISEIEQTAVTSMSRLRRLLFQLDSAALNEMGLSRALSRYLTELFPEGAPRTTFRSRLKTEPPSMMSTVLYRIVQEALNNVRKHAQAKRVSVVLAPVDDGVQVTVEDDGLGFDVEAVNNRMLPGHMGMRSMLERATMADGWLEIESQPGAGATVRVWLPTPGDLEPD